MSENHIVQKFACSFPFLIFSWCFPLYIEKFTRENWKSLADCEVGAMFIYYINDKYSEKKPAITLSQTLANKTDSDILDLLYKIFPRIGKH